jgi:copper chaperone NosL
MRPLAVALVVLTAVACEPSADTPVDPVWGKQACAHCGMIVGERRYAAELTRADGARAFFDDDGCMVAFLREEQATPRRLWVHDADSERWLEASSARYEEAGRTPMDFGFVAHDVAHGGIPYDEMRARVLARLDAEGAAR